MSSRLVKNDTVYFQGFRSGTAVRALLLDSSFEWALGFPFRKLVLVDKELHLC